MNLDLEYYVFSHEDPIEHLKTAAGMLPIGKKRKISPYIRRADAMLKKADPFREMLINDKNNEIAEILASCFVLYFDAYVDKGRFVAVAKDPAFEFVKYVSGMMGTGVRLDDKYLKKVNTLICRNADYIDAFIKAFLNLRIAQSELTKLITA